MSVIYFCHTGSPENFQETTILNKPHNCADHGPHSHGDIALPENADVETRMGLLAEEAVTRAVFGNELNRRAFIQRVGAGTAAAILASVFPMGCAREAAQTPDTSAGNGNGGLEKTDLKVGFIPITCATPIIMADPLGFYKKNGLNVQLQKVPGWAVVRDMTINNEIDASHMLTPMPIALSMGLGSQKVPFVMPTVANINGQAITLHIKHKAVKGPQDMKGFRFCVPFDYSMHNLLLRYYLAEGGVNPDTDVEIKVVPPPQMVANLKAQNVDGFLTADPFNQRAVFEKIGFLHLLSKDIWNGHPCCAFAASEKFVTENPKTYKALFTSLVESGMYAHDQKNRVEIAKAIAPTNYLNQPVELVEQVLTGKYPDGLGNMMDVPDRIDFFPFPYESMAVWIMTQLKRWGYIAGDVDYQKIAAQVYQAGDCRDIMKANGFADQAPATNSKKSTFLIGKNKEFDPAKPEEYLASFAIKSTKPKQA